MEDYNYETGVVMSEKYMTQTFYVGGGDADKEFRNAIGRINLHNGRIKKMCMTQERGFIIYTVV